MVEVLHPGLWSSIQDQGRIGFRNIGVPLSGTMDREASTAANRLLGNKDTAAIIECTFMGPTLRFQKDAWVAVKGAPFPVYRNQQEIPDSRPIELRKGDTFRLGTTAVGRYAYIAVQGGFDTERVMGSRSQHAGITQHSHLQKGTLLAIGSDYRSSGTTPYTFQKSSNVVSLPVKKGPEYDQLSTNQRQQLERERFIIQPQSNRMAFVLEAEKPISVPEIITGPVQPGTVQITPSGRCMLLMRDCQTTGGYGRIFQLPKKAIITAAQLSVHSQIKWEL
ncbi:biotin-dependent carboxyltransferase family protein [Altibacter sp. HG106]|uniref:5-oxoprolinase subunit C family protein n=1 Tax=Altibacter sp. HG106 TaxID=3023937 RepID=UPI002350E0DC|nr:biotin-dependent carboxyltransferase family protein [Altibacter sp. HG106]MDC7995424.1 biotin-dependent carboxyltransferase family protein [Altibacter sp. HG106]